MNTLTVSKKVYADISERVRTSFVHAPSSATETMRIIDSYLAGGDIASDDPSAMLAFNMIKTELDRAAERSRKARQRALERKQRLESGNDTPETTDMTDSIMKLIRNAEEAAVSTEPEPVTLRVSRSERRKEKRRPKNRWKPICAR